MARTLTLDTALLAAVAYAATTAPGNVYAVDGPGAELWTVSLQGLQISVRFYNHTDRWTIYGPGWHVGFRFIPSMEPNPNDQWFGVWGAISETQIKGDLDLLEQHLTLFKVLFATVPQTAHTFVDFKEGVIGP